MDETVGKRWPPTFAAMEVVTLRWPVEEERRQVLAASRVPRLLVVDGEHEPPEMLDLFEDWIRVPALEVDRIARLEAIRQRVTITSGPPVPEIDENGLAPAQAVIESAQRRLRPILLTTGTTVGGLIPLWLHGGPMFEPMAIAILFGLLFATGLTLGVVPVLYSLFFRVDFRGTGS